MNIKFVSTGGAFDYDMGNSSALVWIKNKVILIDCGYSIYKTLREKNFAQSIDMVLVTHLHDDHMGSLSTLLFDNSILHGKRLTVICPTGKFREQLIDMLSYPMIDPEKHCDFVSINQFSYLDYVDTFGRHVPRMPSFAFLFKEGDDRLVYSGDIRDADFLFDQVAMKGFGGARVFCDVSFNEHNLAHVYYKDLEKYAEQYELFGYHCHPKDNPSDNSIPLVIDRPEFLL